ncbi:type 1 glutamine amidotransferase [Microtetraspora niveoalba]|uniref:type 1 glutamine amidotransferase n=1 Tax=Microtetraspora niveoalba TaxID=46175 RepID=UPI000A00568C|nr:type 1 glutamine amidotransferase [Microtetraspora niveoalba]
MSERVVVVEHEAHAGLGFFAEWLEDAGIEYEVVRPHRGEAVPSDPGAGLVVLGGSPSAWDDDGCAWLPDTRALIAGAVRSGVPTLGVCLGAQLMTIACGGAVERGSNGLEIGLGSVELLPEAADDRLFGPVAAAAAEPRAVQYHYDAMTALPPGAVRLATGSRYPNQAYRLGDSAWAVQFHPEATPEIFASWTAAGDLADHDVAELDREVKEAEPALRAAWRPLAEAFAGLVREHREGRGRR